MGCRLQAEAAEEFNLPYWRKRGEDDARRDVSPLFRRKGGNVYGTGDVPDDWSEAGEQARGESYLAGDDAAKGCQ